MDESKSGENCHMVKQIRNIRNFLKDVVFSVSDTGKVGLRKKSGCSQQELNL